jgi:hypothetical protein
MESTDFTYHYPDWLGDALVRGSLPWNQGLSVTMPNFLQEYTLHDSIWEGLWAEPAFGEATAIVRWDSFWTEGRVPYPSGEHERTGSWPLLLIRFRHVYQVVVTQSSFGEPGDFPDIIIDSNSRNISQKERESLLMEGLRQPMLTDDALLYLLDDELIYTEIIGLSNQRTTRIFHGGSVLLLCFQPTGELVLIPGLD